MRPDALDTLSRLDLIPLRELRVSAAVARDGGIRPAAETLLRTASAVSRAIGQLEQRLRVPLFERHGRGMLPTPAGRLAYARFCRIEHELEQVLDEAARAGRTIEPTTAAVEGLFDERRLTVASLLAETGHMPTVAWRLGVSQPAVSASIARLEAALHERLFLRTPSGMVPSTQGGRWLLRFDRALAELRYLNQDIAALRGSMAGVIAVGALPLARTRILPQAIATLRAAHPELRVHARESPYEQLCADLLSGKLDFIIGALRPDGDQALHHELLFTDELCVMAATTHPLAQRRRVQLADLRGQSWVLSRPGTPLRESLEAFFAAHGEPPPVPAVETGDLALVRGMLVTGGMLTVLSTHQLQYEVEAGQLCMLPVSLDGLQRRIGITTRSGAQLPDSVRALLDEIRVACGAAV
ncbi:MAG: LysR family transcriptional regulator [Pigmentiphaga sp.]|uniref:LysR family transcriptional regulator n=1 Tax=Pigmentiphaga sp. TaxID=1977564 RepID=UPI0029B69101|nr:LysR family transcriptional regulator [Pigmentiphaga sp.]MDX3905135.1 LysR family transcriptional regulator [Pigmentiphaga sp.]